MTFVFQCGVKVTLNQNQYILETASPLPCCYIIVGLPLRDSVCVDVSVFFYLVEFPPSHRKVS